MDKARRGGFSWVGTRFCFITECARQLRGRWLRDWQDPFYQIESIRGAVGNFVDGVERLSARRRCYDEKRERQSLTLEQLPLHVLFPVVGVAHRMAGWTRRGGEELAMTAVGRRSQGPASH